MARGKKRPTIAIGVEVEEVLYMLHCWEKLLFDRIFGNRIDGRM